MEVSDELMLFAYRESFHLSYEEAIKEPWQEVERAFHIWSLRRERDKLEEERRAFKKSSKTRA